MTESIGARIAPCRQGERIWERMRKFGLELHPGENAIDRVWAVCGKQPEQTWRGETRDFRFSWFYAHMRTD